MDSVKGLRPERQKTKVLLRGDGLILKGEHPRSPISSS